MKLEAFQDAKDVLTTERVFGTPFERNGTTVIPAAAVRGGGGGGKGEGPEGMGGGSGSGFGMSARPIGAFVIRDGNVTWQPAIDANRAILGGQILAGIALLTVRTFLKRRARRRT